MFSTFDGQTRRHSPRRRTDIAHVAAIVKSYAEKYLPFGRPHLDHGRDYESAVERRRVLGGCSMAPPPSKRTRITKEVTRLARTAGVSSEAELGHVDRATDAGDRKKFFTRPGTLFVGKTGVDALAVAIGTAGLYKRKPRLDLDLVQSR